VATQEHEERFKQFKKDVDLLKAKGFTHTKVGEKMKVSKSNFSNYYRGIVPVTEDFLLKFYQAWAERLPEQSESKKDSYDQDPEMGDSTGERPNEYRVKDIIVEKLVDGQNRLINANMILAESNKIAAESYKILAESHQKLIDLFIQQGGKSDMANR